MIKIICKSNEPIIINNRLFEKDKVVFVDEKELDALRKHSFFRAREGKIFDVVEEKPNINIEKEMEKEENIEEMEKEEIEDNIETGKENNQLIENSNEKELDKEDYKEQEEVVEENNIISEETIEPIEQDENVEVIEEEKKPTTRTKTKKK